MVELAVYVRKSLRILAYGLFWSWNVIFLAFMFLGFAPQMLPEIVTAVRADVIPVTFLAYAVILTVIPAAAVVLGLTALRKAPGRLLALGYGVEGPLMLIVAARFFAVRELTPAMTLLLVIAGVGQVAFLWQLLDRRVDARGPLLRCLRVVGLTCLLATGLYASAWIAFYVAPLVSTVWNVAAGMLDYGLGNVISDLMEGIAWLPLWVLGLILALYSATLFAAMPVAVSVLYARSWWRGVRAFVAGHGWIRAGALVAGTLAACIVLVVLAARQPQHRAFALLEDPPTTPDEARALLDQEEAIRAGLLNAYLAPFRYVSAVGEVRHVSEMYIWELGMSPGQAAYVQDLYEIVARPLLYEPVNPPEAGGNWWDNRALREEPLEAAELYERFFDRPIIDGERESVVRAVRSTWSFDQAQAAWQAVDDREVHLVRQEVSVVERGDWAEVELYEVYQNQTVQRQEVVYYFSLPESAAVTGVWLGNSSDRGARFACRVAPRGAAQEVYRSEVRYNRDPALVEQIGPRQYRLRVFPVEPMVWGRDDALGSTLEEAPPLHVWLTYRVLADDGAWPLPRLAERRNVYWDAATVRLVNGTPMQVDGEAWLPASVAAAGPVEPAVHRVDFPSGETVVARPVLPSSLPEPPGGLRLAVVLDRSRSMVEYEAGVGMALTRLAELADAEVDVYLTASRYRGEEPSVVGLDELDPGGVMYYGGQNAAELLVQFDALHAGRAYDAVLVLTDGGGYELAGDGVEVPVPGAPVWMVHLGGDFPLGYDDATLEAIQASGGGVAGSVEEALVRLAVGLEAGEGGASAPKGATYDVIDGYVWLTAPGEDAGAELGDAAGVEAAGDGFAAFAARRLILSHMQRHRGALDRPETLDHLHAIAVEHGVVTPYSSMIVLVNEQQERLLEDLEERDDRFQREYEEVGETVEGVAGVTAVPEPEEWLVLALAAAMLVWYVRRRGIRLGFRVTG